LYGCCRECFGRVAVNKLAFKGVFQYINNYRFSTS
jgi:hypothetical protein